MQTLVKAMEEIAKTNSLNRKNNILKKYDSPILRVYLEIALNPYKVYHVSKLPKKIDKNKVIPIPYRGFFQFKYLTEMLEQRKISGHLAANTIAHVLSTYEKSISKWLEKAILKKSIGVGSASVNRVFGNIIPKFGVMLANNKQVNINEVKLPVIVQPKLDGVRAVYIPTMGFMGRNGKHIRNKNIINYFKEVYKLKNVVFDGELYSSKMSFNKLASLLNSEDKEIPRGHLEYIIFDSMSLRQWKDQICINGYSLRLQHARLALDSILNSYVEIIPSITLKKNIIKDVFEMYLRQGYEGVMLKDPKGLYKWKRVTVNSGILSKLKPFITEDCKITGFREGQGRLKGMLGKFLVDFNGVEVGVGTGFSDTERKKFWTNRNKMLGKIIEVKGMEVSEAGSIRHPVFIRLRKDKDKPITQT